MFSIERIALALCFGSRTDPFCAVLPSRSPLGIQCKSPRVSKGDLLNTECVGRKASLLSRTFFGLRPSICGKAPLFRPPNKRLRLCRRGGKAAIL